ncbi:MAG: hypothetical protein WAZ12_03385 [Candidatus Absconditicoccaceae bacterium]
MATIKTIEKDGIKSVEIIHSKIPLLKRKMNIYKYPDGKITMLHNDKMLFEAKSGELIKTEIKTPLGLLFRPGWIGNSYNLSFVYKKQEYNLSLPNTLTLLPGLSGIGGYVAGAFSYKEIQKIIKYLDMDNPFSLFERAIRTVRSYVMNLLLLGLLIIFILWLSSVIKETGLPFNKFFTALWLTISEGI